MPENNSKPPTPAADIRTEAQYRARPATASPVARRRNVALNKGGSVDVMTCLDGSVFAVIHAAEISAETSAEIAPLIARAREKAKAAATLNNQPE